MCLHLYGMHSMTVTVMPYYVQTHSDCDGLRVQMQTTVSQQGSATRLLLTFKKPIYCLCASTLQHLTNSCQKNGGSRIWSSATWFGKSQRSRSGIPMPVYSVVGLGEVRKQVYNFQHLSYWQAGDRTIFC